MSQFTNQQFPSQQGQVGMPPSVQQALTQASQGQFPDLNETWHVGQVFPGKGMDRGFRWIDGKNGKAGRLEINLKLRRSWEKDNQTHVRQETVRLLAFGNKGQALINQLQTGQIIAWRSAFRMNNYKDNQGNFKSFAQFVLADERDGVQSFIPTQAVLPVVDESNPPQHQGGNQQWSQPQGGFPQGQPQGGYQPQQQAFTNGQPQGFPQGQPQGGFPQGQPQQWPQQQGGFPQGQPQGFPQGRPQGGFPQGQPGQFPSQSPAPQAQGVPQGAMSGAGTPPWN